MRVLHEFISVYLLILSLSQHVTCVDAIHGLQIISHSDVDPTSAPTNASRSEPTGRHSNSPSFVEPNGVSISPTIATMPSSAPSLISSESPTYVLTGAPSSAPTETKVAIPEPWIRTRDYSNCNRRLGAADEVQIKTGESKRNRLRRTQAASRNKTLDESDDFDLDDSSDGLINRADIILCQPERIQGGRSSANDSPSEVCPSIGSPFGKPRQVSLVSGSIVPEVSGIVSSRWNEGIIWAHNDAK